MSSLLVRYGRKPLKPVYRLMGDPRNVAHAKKVTQEKQHKAKAAQKSSCAPASQESANRANETAATEESAAPKPEAEKPPNHEIHTIGEIACGSFQT